MTEKYIAAIGGTDDAAATTGDGTVIALLKGLRGLLGSGATGTASGLMGILRGYTYLTLSIASGTATSGVFDMRPYAGGHLGMPAAWTTANVGFQVAPTSTGSFYGLYDPADTLVEISGPDAGKTYELPTEMYGAHYGRLWSEMSATGTLQGGDRTFDLMLKA